MVSYAGSNHLSATWQAKEQGTERLGLVLERVDEGLRLRRERMRLRLAS